jgi:hypothetical protein
VAFSRQAQLPRAIKQRGSHASAQLCCFRGTRLYLWREREREKVHRKQSSSSFKLGPISTPPCRKPSRLHSIPKLQVQILGGLGNLLLLLLITSVCRSLPHPRHSLQAFHGSPLPRWTRGKYRPPASWCLVSPRPAFRPRTCHARHLQSR